MSDRLGTLVVEVVPPLAQLLARMFLYALAFGLQLVVHSFVGALIFRRRRPPSSRYPEAAHPST